MATSRASGYVVTAAVWNAVLSRLSDDGATFTGAVNGSTGAFSSTLAVTGNTALGGTLAVTGGTIFLSPTLTIAGADAVACAIRGRSLDGISILRGYSHDGITPYGEIRWNDAPNVEIRVGSSVDLKGAFTANGLDVIGRVQASAQPGFLAYNSANDTSVSNNTTIDFDTEVYDEAGNFSGDTFTAPVTGRYLLAVCVLVENTSGGAITMQAVIRPSNHPLGIQIGYRENVANGDQIAFSGSCIVDMDAADTAVVTYYGGGTCTVTGDANQRYTWFCGRLLP